MPADSVVRARIDTATKKRASAALAAMGLSISDAIRLLMLRIADEQRLPFKVKVPNVATRRAMAEWSRAGASGSTPPTHCSRTWASEVRVAVRSGQFRRDVKRAQRRGKAMSKLWELILLLAGDSLPERYKDHPLKGTWKGYRDAHIEPDWLLIYRVAGDELQLVRTGSHAGLSDD